MTYEDAMAVWGRSPQEAEAKC